MTIAGQSYPHLLFQLILSHSGWRYAEVAAGETFLALQQGLQNALWTLGGVPEVVRSDNTSALPPTNCAAAAAALLTTITPPCWTTMASAPPASIPARAMKTASPSTPTTGSRTPSTRPSSCGAAAISTPNRRRLRQLRPADGGETQSPGTGEAGAGVALPSSLPLAPVPEYVNYQSKVRKWCTIQVAGHSYSVPSRLIGKEVQIRHCTPTGRKCTTGHRV